MPARVEPDADDVSLGAVSIGVDGADPRPSGDAGNLCSELVVHGADTPGHTTLGNAIPAPGFSGAVGSGGRWTTSVEFPQLSVPACQLREGGG
jgi:hypothetical protein